MLSLAADMIASAASSDCSVKSAKPTTSPDFLSKVQNCVIDAGCAPFISCLILTTIDSASEVLCVT